MDEAYERLVETIATGSALCVVGGGSSAQAGFPPWGALLAALADGAKKLRPSDSGLVDAVSGLDDPLFKAEKYEQLLGRNTAREMVARMYGPERPDHKLVHEHLVRLPFQHFLTLNYDRVLEAAYLAVYGRPARHLDFRDRDAVRRLGDDLGPSADGPWFVHLHGSISDPEQIILTLSDYNAKR